MSTTRPPRDTSPPQPAEPSMREDLWRAAHHPGTAAGADVIEAPEALRPVVPSDRELELGLAADGHAGPAPAPAQPQREKLSLRQRGRRLVHDYRPSEVTAGTSAVPLVVISTITLLDSMDANGLGILLPYMRKDLGFDIRFLAAMGQILGIVSTILAPLIGYMADRVSRTKMGFIGVTGSGIASFVTGLGSTRLHLAATRTGSGIVSSLNNPIGLPLLADYYPPQTRGRVFSFYFTGGQLGTIIGPLVAGALATVFSWRAAFFFLGGLSALAGIGFLFLKEPVRGSMDRLSAGVSQEEAQKPPPPPPGLVESWRACASIVTLRRLWYAEPFLTVGGSGLAIVLIVYQVDVFRLPAGVVAVVTALGAVSGMIGLVVGGPMVDRFVAYRPGRVLTLLGALLVIDIFLFIGLAFSRIVWISLPIVLLLPGINSILIPARTAIETLVIPARIRGIGLQTKAPWRLLGSLMFLGLLFLVDSSSDPIALLVYLPLFLAGALLHIAAGAGVERDIRAARAADLAEQAGLQSQESGREALLICRDVDVHYEGVQILFGVDFDVAQCEIVALLGTNGAGKSTLLRAISGLTEASNGAIFLDGRDITHVPPYEIAARRVVQMPGGRGIFPTLSVAENLRAATWLSEDDEKFIESQMTRILEEFFPALRARLDEPAGALSGGEQQMLALGQAFLMRPRLLMIDELSLGLAPGVVRQLVSILKELRELGSTIILVEQSVHLALEIADRAVFMEKGEVRFSGPTEELLRRPDILRSVFLRAGADAPPAPREGRADAAGTTALEARDIVVTYGGIRALAGASIEAAAAEIVGVIGPNGAGKTTLFDVISGFVTPDSGTVTIGGRDATHLGPHARAGLGLGRSFQDARLFGSMTVFENVLVSLERHLESRSAIAAALWVPRARRTEKRVRKRAEDLIAMLGLGDFRDKFVSELSTGSRRIVDLACVMAAEPDIVLLDEPSSGIAQAEAEELGPLLLRVRRDTGCAMVVIEHDMDLITSVADRLVAMELGAVLMTGPPQQVISDPRVTASYLGGSTQ